MQTGQKCPIIPGPGWSLQRGILAAAVAVMTITGAAAAQPQLIITEGLNPINSGDTFDFGDVELGSVGEAFTVRNVGNQTLTITSTQVIGIDGVSSASANLTATSIAAGGFAIMTFEMELDEPGEGSATVRINSNDPVTPQFLVTFTANGVVADLLITQGINAINPGDTLALDPVAVGDSTGVALTVRNIGTGTLVFDNFQKVTVTNTNGSAADDFEAVLAANEIAPGGFAVMTLAFTPVQAGEREVEVTVRSNDPDPAEYTFTVTAEAFEDCNLNTAPDADDIAAGTSEDCNFNGVPDECETDTDGDGVIDDCDLCPGLDDLLDSDGDLVADCLDNCPDTANADQTDTNGDGVGDVCELQDEPPIDDKPPVFTNCGAGFAGLMPAMIAGFCGLRGRPRRRS